MLALLSPLFGIFGSLLPSIVRIFERRQELQHEINLTKLKIDAAIAQSQIQLAVENVKADVDEGKSVRDHDSAIDGGKFINALRSSIRPVITYLFFFLFVAIKVSAAYVMLSSGQSVPETLKSVWDPETQALFSTIMAFWFGARVLDKMRQDPKDEPRNNYHLQVTARPMPPAAPVPVPRPKGVDTRPPSGPQPRTE